MPLPLLGIDHVISVCQTGVVQDVECEHYDQFPIADGPHDFLKFKAAVDTVLDALADDHTTLVHCHAGVSRSAATCAAAIAVRENLSYDDALDEVAAVRSWVNPHQNLEASARTYIDKRPEWVPHEQ